MKNKRITQAFILGAGLGTRLRPITNTMPKVMIPIAPGKPLLEHEIEFLRDQGIVDFVINIHYLPEVITSYFGDGSKWGVHIQYSDERSGLLETGGALKKAEPFLDDDFLFIYGDQLFFFDFIPVIDFHRDADNLATFILKTSDIPADGEVLDFDIKTKRIIASHVRPHNIGGFTETRMLNSGLYALSKQIVASIPTGTLVKFDGEIVPKLLAEDKPLYAFPTNEMILDLGTPEKYQLGQEYYREKQSKRLMRS